MKLVCQLISPQKDFTIKAECNFFFHIHHQENFIFLDSIFQVKQGFYLLVLYLQDFNV